MIGDLYFTESPYTYVIHSTTKKSDSNDIRLVSYSIDVGVLLTFSGTSGTSFSTDATAILIASVTYQMSFWNSEVSGVGALF